MRNNIYMQKQGEIRRSDILDAGIALWPNCTSSSIARRLNITHAAVIYHFPDVHKAVAEYALKINYLPVVVQLIASNDPATENMSPLEKHKALRDFIKSIVTVDNP